MNDGVSAGVARIIMENDFDGEKIIDNLRRECKRVLGFLDDADALSNIQRGWFGAYGASTLYDLMHATKAVIAIYTEDKKELQEKCRNALELKEKAMALYEAIKAVLPEEQ